MGQYKAPGTNIAEVCLVRPQWEKIGLILRDLRPQGRGRSGMGKHPFRGKGEEEWDVELWEEGQGKDQWLECK